MERKSSTHRSEPHKSPNTTQNKLAKSQSPNRIARKLNHGGTLSPNDVIMLQRTIGNQAVQRMMAGKQVGLSVPKHFLQRDDEPSGDMGDSEPMEDLAFPFWGPAPEREEESGDDDTSLSPIGDMVASDVTAVQEASDAFKGQMQIVVSDLASQTGGTLIMGPTKSIERVLEKALKKIKKGRSGVTTVTHDIKDILRCTITYDSFADLSEGYRDVVKILQGYSRGGLIDGFSKITSGFGDEPTAASGYRDAKLIFRMIPPPKIRAKFSRMMSAVRTIPVEVQFNTPAALAVKDAKPPGASSDDEWNFEKAGGPTGALFDGMGFLIKILAEKESEDDFVDLVGDIEDFLSEHGEIVAQGLPIGHHIYEDDKKAKIADYLGLEDPDQVETIYNPIYQKLYDFAYRYSEYNPEDGQKLDKKIKQYATSKVSS